MHLLKHKDLYIPKMNLGEVGLKGQFRLVLQNENGDITRDTGWFSNLITDLGLELASYSSFTFSSLSIGSDVTPPAVTDVAMGSLLDKDYVDWLVASNSGTPNYDMYLTCEVVFAPGDGTGTVREVGMGMDSTAQIATRALVTPEIVKTAVDQLTVYWRLDITPTLVDSTGTVTLDGVSYDWVGRFCNLDDTWTVPGRFHCKFRTGAQGAKAIDGVIQSVDSRPTNYAGGASPGSQLAKSGWEVANTVRYSGNECTFTHDNANMDISAFWFPGDWDAQWDGGLQFSLGKTSDGTPLTKENTHTLIIEGRILLSRTP